MTEDHEGRRDRMMVSSLPAEPISVRIATAVKLTGISRSRIYELIDTGEIKTKKIGRSTFVIYRSLKRLIEGEDLGGHS